MITGSPYRSYAFFLLFAGCTFLPLAAPCQETATETGHVATIYTTSYSPKDYTSLIGKCALSEKLWINHLALYQGYVKNTNMLNEIIKPMLFNGRAETPEFAELKRRFGWEYNGMRLHELFFQNMGGTGDFPKQGKLRDAIDRQFGGYEIWLRSATAMAKMRGIGWFVLYQDVGTGMLINCWIDQHDTGHLAGCKPLLVIDFFEHAYMLDYGLKKSDYFTNLIKHIDWKVVDARFQ
ncbi:MAG TPA: Fe-Mn family superoxide dismutase [Candidatus Ozemobacteraceae bacterium]|nr:Fe-Mn family superoxide dismutase [Candidatus Ozemobacteraceae bacterium]